MKRAIRDLRLIPITRANVRVQFEHKSARAYVADSAIHSLPLLHIPTSHAFLPPQFLVSCENMIRHLVAFDADYHFAVIDTQIVIVVYDFASGSKLFQYLSHGIDGVQHWPCM